MFLEDNISKPRKPKRPKRVSKSSSNSSRPSSYYDKPFETDMFNPEATLSTSRVKHYEYPRMTHMDGAMQGLWNQWAQEDGVGGAVRGLPSPLRKPVTRAYLGGVEPTIYQIMEGMDRLERTNNVISPLFSPSSQGNVTSLGPLGDKQTGASVSLSKQLEKLITNTPERESFLKLLDVLRKSGN